MGSGEPKHNLSYSLRCLLASLVMRLTQEWLNRPRDVDFYFCAGLCPQLFGWLVGWSVGWAGAPVFGMP